MKLFSKWRRRRYRKALWAAIQDACGNSSGMYANDIHPVNGLRVIRIFEEVNKVKFDPFNRLHRHLVAGKRALCVLRHMRIGLGKIADESRARRAALKDQRP